MEDKTKLTILYVVLLLMSVFSIYRLEHYRMERDLYLNRMYDIDRQLDSCNVDVELWEERATNNLKVVKGWCDELNKKYNYVMFNASDCQLITETQMLACEKSNPSFVIQN